jgi:hypothetical protein
MQHGNSIVLPHLRRSNAFRETILFDNNNSLDILDYQKFEKLKNTIKGLSN